MENPLDVLTRAASILEKTRHKESTNGTTPQLDSIRKILPTREQRNARLHELPGYYSSKRTAGTQTPFSSFDDDEPRSSTDHRSQAASHHATVTSSALGGSSMRPMTLPLHPTAQTHPNKADYYSNGRYPYQMESPTSPLNLSISSATRQFDHVARPSVITSASLGRDAELNARKEFSSVSMCDPAIEEHFRRSLGRNYPQYPGSGMVAGPVPTSQPSPPMRYCARSTSTSLQGSPVENNVDRRLSNTDVTITESIDDHFAKSLGNQTWSEIKKKTETVDVDVDEHFKKALGDKWNQIQANNGPKYLSSNT